jgi:hypothetical protein
MDSRNYKSINEYLNAAKSVDDEVESRLYPTGSSVGLKHKELDSGIYIRDDGSIEINAAGTSILVDGKSGSIYIGAKKVATVSNEEVHLSSPKGYVFGAGYLNPAWLISETSEQSACSLGPLVARSAGALNTKIMVEVAGSPTSVPTPLSSLVDVVPLFSRRPVASRISSYIKTIIAEG